ncbi:MAG: FAD-dependent oxidoreductase [Pseudomonadota bacterium]
MSIAVMSRLAQSSVDIFLGPQVAYRPDLACEPPHRVLAELAALRPAVVVARQELSATVARIQDRLPNCRFVLYGLALVGTEPIDTSALSPRCTLVTAADWERAEYEAFVLAESIARPRAAQPPATSPARKGKAILVGAGVVNLVTALALRSRGHEVAVFDRMSDPLATGCAPDGAGATFSGRDARIFSFNESRHHLARSPFQGDAAPAQFRRQVCDDGWLSRDYDSLSERDHGWIGRLESVPPWAALAYGNDLIDFNKGSWRKWAAIFSLYPELLQESNYIGRLLRIYQTPASFAAGQRAEAEIGALLAPIALPALAEREPALAGAVRDGAIAGALEVRGFSLGVQRFSRNLIAVLQRLGVPFHWRHALDEVRRNAAGEVEGLVIGGALHRADHYVICPGAYGGAIKGLETTLADIGAMVGMWVALPNDGDAPLASPLKVRRSAFASREAAEGANITPGTDAAGRPVLHCSSGHGFIGMAPSDVDAADLPQLARCIQETARELFADKFRRVARNGVFAGEVHHCIRPWTPSGLGILDIRAAAGGGRLVLAGGHNTGGFAQSPEVAEAVACALEGRPHPMHTLYHPQRFAGVFTAPAVVQRPMPCPA